MFPSTLNEPQNLGKVADQSKLVDIPVELRAGPRVGHGEPKFGTPAAFDFPVAQSNFFSSLTVFRFDAFLFGAISEKFFNSKAVHMLQC